LRLEMPHLVYEGTTVDSLFVDVFTKDGALQYNLETALVSTASLTIPNIAYTGNIAKNLILSNFSISDNDGSVKFAIPLNAHSLQDSFQLTFYPGDFILNYEKWNVPEDNYIMLVDNGFIINNLVLERKGQSISVNTKGGKATDPLQLAFNDFNIETLSSIMEGEGDTLFRGIINGEVEIRDMQENMAFTSDLKISNFSYQNDTVGNIALQASSALDNVFNIKAGITGFDNDINLGGSFNQQTKALDLSVDIKNFELASIESFVEESIHTISGRIRGEFDVKGTVDNPDILGNINFINAGFNLVALNSYFTMPDERIIFDEKGIRFPSLTIRDTLNNPVVINGYILTDNYRDMEFDLNIRANNFQALNRPEAQMDLYYGRIVLDSDIRVRGNLDRPVVDARIGLLRGTSLTMIIPETQVAMHEKEGIIEFVTVENDSLVALNGEDIAQDTMRAEIRGIELTANVTIDEQTRFKIIIDESTGDFLEIQGGGTVSFSIDPSGAMALTGIYEIREGQYQLSFYNMVRREFTIRPGSSLSWTGDPLNATVDISAIHTVRTSPADLMASQAVDEQQRKALRGILPFQVFLNMRGELLSPDIDFNINLPDDRKGALGGTVHSRLTLLNEQESELNKQVFALLILGRFIAEDPLEATGGGGVTGTARSSGSRVLTQQLNQLSDRYITGFDLDFDVESYEDYGAADIEGRTELQIGLSREFFDERLRVEVGGRVDLEGERRRQQRNVSDIAGDVAVEYLLSEDGIYRLRAFRRNEFQMLLDGEIIETGLALIYTREFTRFREIFRRRAKVEAEMLPTLDDGTLPEEEEMPVDEESLLKND
ncbi:MAG: translocation/assembly module TamB, partial [Bacteroidetes bacterium]|nr:translocation/assembly module TamB [Bacteroidota bacterium]